MKPEEKTIDPNLEKAFQEFKEIRSRDEQKARQARSQYLNQIAALREAVSPVGENRHKGWNQIPLFRRKEKFSMAATITTIILVVTLFLGGTGGTVYAAQSSLPDDALYPLKLFAENMEEAFTTNADTEMELQLQFANRRMEEIAAMNSEGNVPPEAVMEQLRTRLENALRLASSLDEENITPALLRIQTQLRIQEQTLLQLNSNEINTPLLLRTREMLREQIRLVDSGLEQPLKLQQQLREQERIYLTAPAETEQPTLQATENDHGFGPGANTDSLCTNTCTPTCIGTCTPYAGNEPGPFGTPIPGGNGQGGKP
jgi:hypothetical protein